MFDFVAARLSCDQSQFEVAGAYDARVTEQSTEVAYLAQAPLLSITRITMLFATAIQRLPLFEG